MDGYCYHRHGRYDTEATMDMSMATAEATVDPSMMITNQLRGLSDWRGWRYPDWGDPDGYGVAAISFDPTTNVISFEVAVSGLTLPATASHIHMAPVGESGDVVVPANGMPDAGMRSFPPAIRRSGAPSYSRSSLIHRTSTSMSTHPDYPGGAVRGQLTRTDAALVCRSDGGMIMTMEATPSQ
ncbi:MAG: CHRD domain-containing protein [Anaerolineae bacterium]